MDPQQIRFSHNTSDIPITPIRNKSMCENNPPPLDSKISPGAGPNGLGWSPDLVISGNASFPWDQIKKVESWIHDQKPLCFTYKMERNFAKIQKSGPDSLEIIGSTERNFHFRFFELVPWKSEENRGPEIHANQDKH